MRGILVIFPVGTIFTLGVIPKSTCPCSATHGVRDTVKTMFARAPLAVCTLVAALTREAGAIITSVVVHQVDACAVHARVGRALVDINLAVVPLVAGVAVASIPGVPVSSASAAIARVGVAGI